MRITTPAAAAMHVGMKFTLMPTRIETPEPTTRLLSDMRVTCIEHDIATPQIAMLQGPAAETAPGSSRARCPGSPACP